MSLHRAALVRAIDERNTYRLMLQIALGQAHERERTIASLREQLAAQRQELQERMGVPREPA